MNRFKHIVDIIFSGHIPEIEDLKHTVNTLQNTIIDFQININKKDQELQLLKVALAKDKLSQQIGSERTEYWDNKWKKSNVTFKAQDNTSLDVRNFILEKSYILKPVADKYAQIEDLDERAIAILKDVVARINYTSDKIISGQEEYWQNPEETWQNKRDDCDGGSNLIASLLILSGVPSYRVKVACGDAILKGKRFGHSYCVYLADDNEWYTLDWCVFSGDSIRLFKKKPHKLRTDIYADIWFTFNNQYSWAQKSFSYSKEDIKKNNNET